MAGRAAVMLTTRAAAAAGLALLAAGTAQAGDVLLKDATIVGTLTSWGVAAWNGAPLGRCLTNEDAFGGRVQGGKDKELKFLSIAAVRRECHLSDVGGFSLEMAPVLSAGRWTASSSTGGATRAWDLAFVPMMRWKQPLGASLRYDLEFGIGPAYLSQSHVGDRVKSTNFQFSDHLGIGLGSADGHWRVGLAYRHVSNADIRSPNNAVDFKGLSLEFQP